MEPGQIATERVEAIPWRDSQVFQSRDRVNLVELAADRRPQLPGIRLAALLLTPFQISLVVSSASERIIA